MLNNSTSDVISDVEGLIYNNIFDAKCAENFRNIGSTLETTLPFLSSLVSTAGLIGSLMVIGTYYHESKKKPLGSSELLITALSIIDCSQCINLTLVLFTCTVIPMPPLLELINIALEDFNLNCYFFIVILMTLGRYQALCKPLRFRLSGSYSNPSSTRKVLLAFYALAVLITLSRLPGISYFVLNFDVPKILITIFIPGATIMDSVFSITVSVLMVVCYVLILYTIRKPRKPPQGTPARISVAMSFRISEAKITISIFAVSFVFMAVVCFPYSIGAVCWLRFPFECANFLAVFLPNSIIVPHLWSINYSINPYIYLTFSKSFRVKFLSFLRHYCCWGASLKYCCKRQSNESAVRMVEMKSNQTKISYT